MIWPLSCCLPSASSSRGQPLAREPVVLRADGLDRLVGARGLGADVDAQLPGALVEVLVGEDRVGQPQLLAHPLEQPARHAAAEDVGEDREREAPRIAQREGVGAEDDVGLRGVALLPPARAPRCAAPAGTGRRAGSRALPSNQPSRSSTRAAGRGPRCPRPRPRSSRGGSRSGGGSADRRPRARPACPACRGWSSRRDDRARALGMQLEDEIVGVSSTPLISSRTTFRSGSRSLSRSSGRRTRSVRMSTARGRSASSTCAW